MFALNEEDICLREQAFVEINEKLCTRVLCGDYNFSTLGYLDFKKNQILFRDDDPSFERFKLIIFMN